MPAEELEQELGSPSRLSAVPVDAPSLFAPDDARRLQRPQPPTTLTHLRLKFGQYFRGPQSLAVRCFECGEEQTVSSSAQSATCRKCSAYIDLQNYKIAGTFSRDIKTCGSLLVLARADLASNRVLCGSATIYGKVRANLYCSGDVVVRYDGKFHGDLEGRHLVVEKGSSVEFLRPVRVSSAVIEGRVTADLSVDGPVTVRRHGWLSGSTVARSFMTDQGGKFDGDLQITGRRPFERVLEVMISGSPAASPPDPERPPAGAADEPVPTA